MSRIWSGHVALRIPEERADGFRSASKVTISDARRWNAIIDRMASQRQ